MPVFVQEQMTRLFENIGGAFSGLKRYVDAANLIGSTAYFLFTRKDAFDMFPEGGVALQFAKVKSLLRGIGYSAADEILRLEISEVSPGVSYNLKIVESFGGTVLSTVTGGLFGQDADLEPEQSQTLAPGGKIIVEAPSGNPSALLDEEIEIRVVPSAVRLSTDVTGETTNEGLLEAAALESHQITASNFTNSLLEASRNRIVTDRLLQTLVGEFIGSDTKEVFKENQQRQNDGSVIVSPNGLLPELDFVMKTNVPVQSVEEIIATVESSKFDSDKGTAAGSLIIAERQPTAGTLRLRCTRGFDTEIDDPEEFEVVFLSTTLDRSIKSSFKTRPFRSFEWIRGGFEFTIQRKTEATDPLNRMTNPVIKNATPTRIPLQKLVVNTFVDVSGPINASSFFKITDPKTGFVLFQQFSAPGSDPLADGSFDLNLFNGLNLTFDWTNNPTAGGPISFEIIINPFRVGDTFERTYSISGGKLNVELRRQFDFVLSAAGSSPTIPNTIVTPDLPFVDIFLGA